MLVVELLAGGVVEEPADPCRGRPAGVGQAREHQDLRGVLGVRDDLAKRDQRARPALDRRQRPEVLGRLRGSLGRRGGGLHGELLGAFYCHIDKSGPRDIVKVITRAVVASRAVVRSRRQIARRSIAALQGRVQPRRRRPPELARQEILDAAEQVFAGSQPDQVGLKEVAREAGVSHALITHYFGTYAGLIEATLERRLRKMRELVLARLREPDALGRPSELLEILFRTLQDPVHLRLMRWMLASERPAASHALGLQDRGLAIVAEQIARSVAPERRRELIAEIEVTLLTAVSAAYGYALGKHALIAALGREPSRELDDQVRETLAAMVLARLRSKL
ncbi:MAG: TetR family transcriptional regulator [Deltaproteobacteria bacterium]|nr:MAG: TetR family transcriptional regulator [Deltaproteobacteria bacterium]